MPFRFLRNGVRGNSFISDNVSGKTQSYRTRVYDTPVVPTGFTAFVDPQGIVVPASVVRIGPAAPGSTETLIFTSTQPISIPSPITMDYLIVGGGGASGSEAYPWGGGGGGAGGYRTGSTPVTGGSYVVTVGSGGPATPGPSAVRKGQDSSFNSIVSTGGGGGGGGAGGSGGGSGNAGSSTGAGTGNSPPTTPPQGTPGFGSNSGPGDGGGGGGASSGGPGTSVNGGSGLSSPLSPASYGSPATFFSGGGGSGGGSPSTAGSGGAGGGGQGGPGSPTAGVVNTGGGGGQPLKAGGSGIVILKYNT
jgi:hypothetical protein